MAHAHRRLALWSVLLVQLGAAPAWANGRPPDTTGIAIDPARPQAWMAGVTFGVLLSADAGKSWGWICEEALGGATGTDFIMQWGDAGALLVLTPNGLFVSHDGGCSFQVPAGLAGLSVSDVRVDPQAPATWWLVVNDAGGGHIYRSQDNGQTFSAMDLSAAGVTLTSLRLTPGRSQRLVAVGSASFDPYGPYVYVSDDAGATWQTHIWSGGPDPIVAPVLGLVADANTVLVASLDLAGGPSTLLRSSDGGISGSPILSLSEGLRDFASSADGQTVWLAGTNHLFRSQDGGRTFAPLPVPSGNACVGLASDGLVGCGAAATTAEGWSLARSQDAGSTWTPFLRLSSLTGPVQCAQGTPTHDLCTPIWPAQAAKIGATVADAGSAGSAGSPASTAKAKGSGCQSLGAPGAGMQALAGLVGLWRRRRRRNAA